jgi:hypothetical protein
MPVAQFAKFREIGGAQSSLELSAPAPVGPSSYNPTPRTREGHAMLILTRRVGETKDRVAAAAVLMLLLSGSATAQALAQPTETDLHAAYCIQVLGYGIAAGESVLASGANTSTVPDSADTEEVRTAKATLESSNRAIRTSVDSHRAMLRKLNVYLQPRVFNLDPIGILAAQSAAKDDGARAGSATSACKNECPMSLDTSALLKCNNECALRTMPDLSTIRKKVKSCYELDWLPF